jgi:putative protease
MQKDLKTLELLAPAGDLDKLKTAVRFGADAVYLASGSFGLRARAGNFSLDQLREARRLTREAGVKIYLTLNASLRAAEFSSLQNLLEELKPLELDAYIIADAGVLATIRQIDPQRKLHLSTQANTCNPAAARFWQQAGVCRINLARELTLADMGAFAGQVDMELEAFVHGAMCVAHSGRCLISSALAGRSANRGDCAQPCRWNYQLTEELRPGQPMRVEEDQRGTYFFNSRDLCLVDHLGELAAAGVNSFKIEGRMKGIYYVAITTDVYRQAIDCLQRGVRQIDPRWRAELETVSHRPYDNGFLFGGADAKVHPDDTHYIRSYDFVGVLESSPQGLFIATRNRFFADEKLELIGPGLRRTEVVPKKLQSLKGEGLSVAQPNSQVKIEGLPAWAAAGDMLRRRKAP